MLLHAIKYCISNIGIVWTPLVGFFLIYFLILDSFGCWVHIVMIIVHELPIWTSHGPFTYQIP